MTTIVAVKKNGTVAIAADSLTTFGDTRLGCQCKVEHDKMLHIKGSYIGICDSSAHHLVLENVLSKFKNFKLGSRTEVFETFRQLYPILSSSATSTSRKTRTTPMSPPRSRRSSPTAPVSTGCIPIREVFDYDRFWGIAPGRNFAWEPMFAIYNWARSAAEVGTHRRESGYPPVPSCLLHTVKLKERT